MHHIEAILLLNVGEVLRQRVGMDDVWGFNAVEDHVHDPNHVGQ